MQTMSEEDLITMIEKDTEKGMAVIIDLYGSSVKTICISILNGFPYEDIQEAISDVFVGLWSEICKGNFDSGKTSIKFYLYGIARRTALNKRRKLMQSMPADDIDGVEKPLDFNLEAEILRKSEYEILNSMINELDSPDKEIFLYRYYKQYSIKEIADILKLSAKKVENILTRGRKKLKKQLIECNVTM